MASAEGCQCQLVSNQKGYGNHARRQRRSAASNARGMAAGTAGTQPVWPYGEQSGQRGSVPVRAEGSEPSFPLDTLRLRAPLRELLLEPWRLLFAFDDLAKWKKPARENFFECSVCAFCSRAPPSGGGGLELATGVVEAGVSTVPATGVYEASGRWSGSDGVFSSPCKV